MYSQAASSMCGELLLPLTLKPEAKVYVAHQLAQIDVQKREKLQQLAEKVQLGAEETLLLLPLAKYMAKCFIAAVFMRATLYALSQDRSLLPEDNNCTATFLLIGPIIDICVQAAKSQTYSHKIRIFFQTKT